MERAHWGPNLDLTDKLWIQQKQNSEQDECGNRNLLVTMEMRETSLVPRMFNFDKSLISGWIKINLTFQTALFLKAGYLWATELKISLPLSRCHRPVRGHS